MFNLSSDNRGRLQQLISSQPDRRDCNRVVDDSLSIQSIVVNARRSLLAAAMRRRHPHLPALILHHAAAGALLSAHLRIGNHAGHCRCQACRQQQDQDTELAQDTHSCN